MKYVLDSQTLYLWLGGDQKLLLKIGSVVAQGDTIHVSGMIYYEIKCGAENLKQRSIPTKEFNKFQETAEKYNWADFNISKKSLDQAAWINAKMKHARKRRDDQAKDEIIAGEARAMDAVVVSEDSYFEDMKSVFGLKTESWI